VSEEHGDGDAFDRDHDGGGGDQSGVVQMDAEQDGDGAEGDALK
jgi:hypothetical protein